MTAAVQTTPEQQEAFHSLEKQIMQKKQELKIQRMNEEKNAIPKREAREVHVRQTSADSEEMGGRVEEEGRSSRQAQEKRNGFSFQKGEKNWDVDDDAEFEFLADKKPVKMTLKEMRDAAAGGIAVRNRMRQIAEDKKALYEPYRDFSKTSKEDPLGALQKMFGAIQTVDPDADFDEFIADLAKQAQTLAKMEPSERKAYELEKELNDKKEKLTESEQMNRIAELKEELVAQTNLSDEKIYEFGQTILNHPVLSQTISNEEDLMERIGELAEEIEMQKVSLEALHKQNPDIPPNDPLVFELSNLLKQNPDFDEKDLEDIAEEVLGSVQKAKASQRLSKKQRAWTGTRDTNSPPDFARMKPVDALKWQIENKKKLQQEQQKLSQKRI